MNKIRGIIFVIVGAASYGILATFVKLAGQEGYTTASVTFSQFLLGFIVLAVLDMLRKGKPQEQRIGHSSDRYKLVFGGTCLGLTSTFYYLSVQYLPVSVCIVLLMQTTWMGILVDSVRYRKWPDLNQVIAIVIILGGTLMATDFAANDINYTGCIWGLLAAISYTGAMYAANHVALHRPLFYRSKLLVFGGLVAILLFWNIQVIQGFDATVLLKYGLLLALFGTILPPIFFNKGFPLVGMGLGSVLAVVEIPVSIATAHIILQEEVSGLQVIGCVVLIIGMVVPHLRKRVWVVGLLMGVMPAKAATIDTLKVYSAAMQKEITTVVVRPEQQHVPSVYVLHGYSGHPFRTLALDIPSLPAMADRYGMAFILPDGLFDKWYMKEYETFLGKELPAYIDLHYTFSGSRFGRAIMGWSMGGYGAFHIGMMYSHMYGAIGSMCGAVEIVPFIHDFGIDKLIGNDSTAWKKYDVLSNAQQLAFSQQEIMISCGTSDPFLSFNRQLDQKLNELKIHHTYMEQEGEHNFRYWSEAAEYQVLFFHRFFERNAQYNK